MAVKILVPTILRKSTNNKQEVIVEGKNVIEALRNLVAKYPDAEEQIFEPDGGIKKFVNVFVNGEEIRTLKGEKTRLKKESEISIVPAIAGGAEKIY